MIRLAKTVDTPRIVELLEQMQVGSKYAGKVAVDRTAARQLVAQCIMRSPGSHDGGTLVNVAVVDDVVQGFMIGMLDRVYHIGEKLCANDVFLYLTDKASPRDAGRLIDEYIAWAGGNPKVHEIKLSWTDTMPGAEAVAKMYERKGFRRCGEIFEREIETGVIAA